VLYWEQFVRAKHAFNAECNRTLRDVMYPIFHREGTFILERINRLGERIVPGYSVVFRPCRNGGTTHALLIDGVKYIIRAGQFPNVSAGER
jgi:hypothetical protein